MKIYTLQTEATRQVAMSDEETKTMESKTMESDTEFKDCESDSSSQMDLKKKRKASPLEKKYPKRFTTTARRTGTKTTQKGFTKPKPPTSKPTSNTMSFADAMLVTFSEPTFAASAAPHMAVMMQSTIDSAIEKAVKTAVVAVNKSTESTVNTIMESNRTLQETVKKQNELIEKQQNLIESQTAQIHSNTTQMAKMEKDIAEMTTETDALRLELNHLEQYGRRNSLRFSNMKSKQKDFKTEKEMKKNVAGFINRIMLSPDESISEEDIDRCHEAGSKTKKQILVKFHKYEVKNKVFFSKSNLKENKDGVFVTEDLTRFNQEIIKTLITLRTDKKIAGFWTINGTIYIKIAEKDTPTKIRRLEDLTPLGLD